MSLTIDLQKFADKTVGRIERAKRAVTLKLCGSIIRDTPVLSGRLRGNWQTNIGAPALGELPVRSESATMDELQEAAKAMHGDQTIYFTNNLPYALRIEYDGWSHTKAPEGMVRKNVTRIQQLVADAIREGRLP